MYPQNPDVIAWRAAAAVQARAAGAEVPHWFDGSEDAVRRLNADFPDLLASVRWHMQNHVTEHAADFPPAMRDAAAAFLEKNPRPGAYAGAYSLESYGIGAMAGDFVKAAATTAAEYTADGVLSAKDVLGIKPRLDADPKPAGLSPVALALLGVVIGAGAWFAFGRKGVA